MSYDRAPVVLPIVIRERLQLRVKRGSIKYDQYYIPSFPLLLVYLSQVAGDCCAADCLFCFKMLHAGNYLGQLFSKKSLAELETLGIQIT